MCGADGNSDSDSNGAFRELAGGGARARARVAVHRQRQAARVVGSNSASQRVSWSIMGKPDVRSRLRRGENLLARRVDGTNAEAEASMASATAVDFSIVNLWGSRARACKCE